MITAVYVPPDADANANTANSSISRRLNKYPDAVYIIAGDLNHTGLKQRSLNSTNMLNVLKEEMTPWTRSTPTSSLATGPNHSLTLASLTAWLCCWFLHSAPLRKTTPTITAVTSLSDGASHQLQDCFNSINWDVLWMCDLEVFKDSVLCYIKHCMDTLWTIESALTPTRSPG